MIKLAVALLLVAIALPAQTRLLSQHAPTRTEAAPAPVVMHYYISQIPPGLETYANQPFVPYVVAWVVSGDKSNDDGFVATVTYLDEQGEAKSETRAATKGQYNTGFVFCTGKASNIRVSVRPFRLTNDTPTQSVSN